MKKAVTIILCFYCYLYSGAQDTPRRLNFMLDYSIGLQFFKFNNLEHESRDVVRRNMAEGFYVDAKFKPTVLHQFSLSATIFKNKSYYLGLYFCQGENEAISYGYSSDQNGNPLRVSAHQYYSFFSAGIGIKKEINLNKFGHLTPNVSFYTFDNYTKLTSRTTVIDKNSGEIILQGNNRGSGGRAGTIRSGILMLFDSPKVGIEYNLKLYRNFYINVSYSYWLFGSMINDLYGLTDKYVIKFHNSQHVRPMRQRIYPNDFFSHNLSIGLSFKLYK